MKARVASLADEGSRTTLSGPAVDAIASLLAGGLHVDPAHLAPLLADHPELRDDLLRLASDLRHVPARGGDRALTREEEDFVRQRLLDRVVRGSGGVAHADADRGASAGAPVPRFAHLTRDDVVEAFTTHCPDGAPDAVAKWTRAFPAFAADVLDAASVIAARPPVGVRERRRAWALAQAEALLRPGADR